jgi:NRPS condensation-like uncharacterized protein
VGYELASIHRRTLEDESFEPPPDVGPRGVRQAFVGVSLGDFPGMLRDAAANQIRFALPPRTLRFPAAAGGAAGRRPVFVLRHLDAARLAALKAWGWHRGATLNDLFAAATLRALVRLARWDGRSRLRLKTTVDLRRFVAGSEPAGACNLSSFVFVSLGTDLGEGFEGTLARVKAELDAAKAGPMGLDYLLLLRLLGAGMPFGLACASMRAFLDLQLRAGSAAPTFTNLGPIDLSRLDFGEARAHGAFAVAPAIYPPDFAFGLSGDEDSLTLSAGFFEPAVGRDDVARFFTLIDEELPG